MRVRSLFLVAALLAPSVAAAEIDPKCADVVVEDYDEQSQQDFLSNYFALATTLSPGHGPIPHEAGHGALGLDVLFLPPLPCRRRLVLGQTKTENTNVTPLAPRPRVSFAFDGPAGIVPYAGFAYVPPVPMFGTRNVMVGGELGAGKQLGERLQVGARFHAQMMKTVADVATAFEPDDPVVLDLYIASTVGGDAMIGLDMGNVTPYLSVGFTDVSTFFFVGDDGYVSNNLHPYAGPVASLGFDGLLVGRFRWGAEMYAAPGGYSTPAPTTELKPGARYGHLYTARFHLGIEL